VLVVTAFAACGPSTPTPPPVQATAGPTATAPAASPEATSAAPSPTLTAAASPGTAIDPSNFVATVDNSWFPLLPGTKLTYKGSDDGEALVDTFEITSETKVVDGVTCVVIRDKLTKDGVLAERTEDWYAQDRDGNVWYFGEATEQLDDAGVVESTEGSWTAGVDARNLHAG
jgi:hypothetical protein